MNQIRTKVEHSQFSAEQSNTELFDLCKRNREAIMNYPVHKFWEEAIRGLVVGTREDDTTFIQAFGMTVATKENILTKNMQLSENSEILVVVNLKNKESRSKGTKKPNLNESKGTEEINKVLVSYSGV